MKVLFVCSGNKGEISILIQNQSSSLIKQGIEIDFFIIKGKGIIGYLKNVFKLRRKFKSKKFDLVHAHYSLSGYLCVLAQIKPLIVSLLGSDVKSKKTLRFFNNFFFKYYCSAIIVKSKELEESLKFKNIHIIPNGVDFKKFQEKNKIESLKKLNWNPDKINLIFGGNPNRTEKNFQLTNKTIKKFNDPTVELHILMNINHTELPYYFSAADGLILSSLWEGSPNIIKEAMACNLPIISTKVGDVEILFGDSDGHFLTNVNFQEFYSEFQRFIFYLTENKRPRTKGLKQLIELQLSEEQIANKIIEVYKTVKNARYSNQ